MKSTTSRSRLVKFLYILYLLKHLVKLSTQKMTSKLVDKVKLIIDKLIHMMMQTIKKVD